MEIAGGGGLLLSTRADEVKYEAGMGAVSGWTARPPTLLMPQKGSSSRCEPDDGSVPVLEWCGKVVAGDEWDVGEVLLSAQSWKLPNLWPVL
jgi:hypothetical protein